MCNEAITDDRVQASWWYPEHKHTNNKSKEVFSYNMTSK
jgi:hypothetical protein